MQRPTPASLGAKAIIQAVGKSSDIHVDPLTADDFNEDPIRLVLFKWLETKQAAALPPPATVFTVLAGDGVPAVPYNAADANLVAKANAAAPMFEELAFVALYSDTKSYRGWAASHDFQVAEAENMARIIKTAGVPDGQINPDLTQWAAQRFAAQSTTDLVADAYNALGPDATKFLGAKPALIGTPAARFTPNHGLDEALIAKSKVVLDLVGRKYGDWYQGNSAAAKMAGVPLIEFTARLRAYLKLKSNEGLFKDVPDADVLANGARDGNNAGLASYKRVAAIKATLIKMLKDDGIKLAEAEDLEAADIARIAAAQGAAVKKINPFLAALGLALIPEPAPAAAAAVAPVI